MPEPPKEIEDPLLRRVGLFLTGFFLTFTASLAMVDGGQSLKLAQLLDIPVIVWGSAVGNGVLAAMTGRVSNIKRQ